MRRIAGAQPDLTDLAWERWQVTPAERHDVPPAIRLPDQAERIIRTEFAPLDAVLRSFRGNPAEQ
ncbi:glycosyltransferase family 61 protein, partial [Paracoccus sp. EGI L200073]|nr:glycosyltransferase family 61 protein [Paracoccus salsus]